MFIYVFIRIRSYYFCRSKLVPKRTETPSPFYESSDPNYESVRSNDCNYESVKYASSEDVYYESLNKLPPSETDSMSVKYEEIRRNSGYETIRDKSNDDHLYDDSYAKNDSYINDASYAKDYSYLNGEESSESEASNYESIKKSNNTGNIASPQNKDLQGLLGNKIDNKDVALQRNTDKTYQEEYSENNKIKPKGTTHHGEKISKEENIDQGAIRLERSQAEKNHQGDKFLQKEKIPQGNKNHIGEKISQSDAIHEGEKIHQGEDDIIYQV